jgi:hypothetical protein
MAELGMHDFSVRDEVLEWAVSLLVQVTIL